MQSRRVAWGTRLHDRGGCRRRGSELAACELIGWTGRLWEGHIWAERALKLQGRNPASWATGRLHLGDWRERTGAPRLWWRVGFRLAVGKLVSSRGK